MPIFSPDNKKLIANSDRGLQVCDAESGHVLYTLTFDNWNQATQFHHSARIVKYCFLQTGGIRPVDFGTRKTGN